MDWNSTNNSTVTSWSQRTAQDYHTQTNSVAFEYMIDLCNTTSSNMWICIPQEADDTYVTNLATLIKNTLNSNLVCYVEVSNEVWNGLFSAAAYFTARANSLGISGTDFQKSMRAYSRRSVECFALFDTVYGVDARTRTKRVLAGQSGNTGVGDLVLGFESAYLYCDHYSTAPYFYATGATNSMSVSQILDLLEAANNGVANARANMVADVGFLTGSYPTVTPVFYEGGQHLTTSGADPALDTLYKLANRHTRMQTIYASYLTAWREVTNNCLFCHYASCQLSRSSGSWGALERLTDTATEPEYLALIAALGA